MGVNRLADLPKTVTRQRRDCNLNRGPSAPESSTPTTRLRAGEPRVTKSVIHVDNLDIDFTPELLKDYLLTEDITVLSCYNTRVH